MSSDNSRLRFYMGCGECLQSRHWIVQCVSGVQRRTGVKPESCKSKRDVQRREADRS